MENKMNSWLTGCSLAAAQLLGACAADGSAPTDDHAPGSPTNDEQAEIAVRRDSLWMEGCDQDKIDKLYAASFYSHFALEQAVQTYWPGSDRVNHYFGVGHNAEDVELTLMNMWYINLSYEPTTYVCGGSTGKCNRGGAGYPPAYVEPSDVENKVERIVFCDSAFDTNVVCDQGCAASLTGIVLHETAHLAGATAPDPVGWSAVQSTLAMYDPSWWGYMTPNMADIYHYYILNLPTD
jgi:hypothetical protein